MKDLFGRLEHQKHNRFIKLLLLSKRGIGYHHDWIDSKGRTFVEMLFRMGYIKVSFLMSKKIANENC